VSKNMNRFNKYSDKFTGFNLSCNGLQKRYQSVGFDVALIADFLPNPMPNHNAIRAGHTRLEIVVSHDRT
jgi:hypothetical protein